MTNPNPEVTIKAGDKITAVVNKPGRAVFVAKGVVHSMLSVKGMFFAQLSENGRLAHNVYLHVNDEGSTWVKGHIDAASPKEMRNHPPVQAAAEALDK